MKLPQIPSALHARLRFDPPEAAFAKWNPAIQAAEKSDSTIGIYDVIGDYWGEGTTSRRIAGALRAIGAENPVTVNLNSPGGDMFEGIAIYNLLREHKGEVTVKVLGMAASAASIIAMAGDRVEVGRSAFLMIHNAWVIAAGDRNDLREFAEQLEPFDRAMADVYTARTGLERDEVAAMMDRETWIGGSDAVDQGFADALLASDEVEEDPKAHADRVAAHQIDLAMAKAGMPRSERRRLMKEFKSSTQLAAGTGTPGAAGSGTQIAALAKETAANAASLESLLEGYLK